MTIYRGRPFSPVESQMDLMKSHTIRPVQRPERTEGGRTLQLAVPAGWTEKAKCLGNSYAFDDAVGLKPGEAMGRCVGCPVIEQCLSAAMEEETGLSAGYRYTVRGGLSPKERAELAFAERECERGHKNRWSKDNSVSVRCLECQAEDVRERYRLQREDPEWMDRRRRQLRERESAQRVSCLECRTEMRARALGRHVAKQHGESEAA